MSFIDTIALPLFILVIGVVALTFVGGYIFRLVMEARATLLAAKRDTKLEQQTQDFVERLAVEASCSDPIPYTLSDEMSRELWEVRNQLKRKELTR
jgi:hypothetical protein